MSTYPIIAMEPEQLPAEPMEVEPKKPVSEEEKDQIIANLREMAQFQELPEELKQHILGYLPNALLRARGHTETAKLYNAADNIRNVMMVNKALYSFINHPQVTGYLITELAKLYARKDLVEVALAIGTKAAAQWLRNNTSPGIYLQSPQKFLEAAERGKVGVIRFLLESMVNKKAAVVLLASDQNKRTAIMLALINGNEEIVKLILAKAKLLHIEKEMLSIKSGFTENTSLILAVNYNRLSVIDELIANSPVNQVASNGTTAIFEAAARGYDLIVEKLLRAGANPNISIIHSEVTPLIVAIQNDHLNVVQKLLTISTQPPIEINKRDKKNHTALWHARNSTKPHKDAIIKLLLEHGATE